MWRQSAEEQPLPAIVPAGLGTEFGYRKFNAQQVHDSAGTSQGNLTVSESSRFGIHGQHRRSSYLQFIYSYDNIGGGNI